MTREMECSEYLGPSSVGRVEWELGESRAHEHSADTVSGCRTTVTHNLLHLEQLLLFGVDEAVDDEHRLTVAEMASGETRPASSSSAVVRASIYSSFFGGLKSRSSASQRLSRGRSAPRRHLPSRAARRCVVARSRSRRWSAPSSPCATARAGAAARRHPRTPCA